jgi:hypothetical protein
MLWMSSDRPRIAGRMVPESTRWAKIGRLEDLPHRVTRCGIRRIGMSRAQLKNMRLNCSLPDKYEQSQDPQ